MTTTRGGGEIGLRSCAEATVIEDLLEVITPVSGLVKRNLDLIRQLGATATSELEAVEKEEAKVEKDVVEELDKRAAAAKPAKKLEEVIGDKKDFEERGRKRRRCDGLFEEAIEVARQTEVAVARHIDHIDGELAKPLAASARDGRVRERRRGAAGRRGRGALGRLRQGGVGFG